MTSNMKVLWEVLKTEFKNDPNCTVECLPQEWRTAKALERRGLIQVLDGRGLHGHFEVKRSNCIE